jgi:hypothetical protein
MKKIIKTLLFILMMDLKVGLGTVLLLSIILTSMMLPGCSIVTEMGKFAQDPTKQASKHTEVTEVEGFGDYEANAGRFYRSLITNPRISVIVDLSKAPELNDTLALKKCFQDIIYSGYLVRSEKNIAWFACNETGCLSNNPDQNTDVKKLISYEKVKEDVSGSVYISIMYGDSDKTTFSPNYALLYHNQYANPARCKLELNNGLFWRAKESKDTVWDEKEIYKDTQDWQGYE